MRIAFMLTSLGIGGTERQVVALAERMRARGHAVMIVVLAECAPQEWPAQVEVVHLALRRNFLDIIRGVARAVPVLRAFRPQILHCHNFHGNIVGRLLKVLFPHVRVVSTIHNVYEGGRLRMIAYRLTDPLSQCTVAVCDAAARHLTECGAAPRRRICHVIANGIDPAEFTPDPERRAAMRERMGAADRFIWIAVGRVVLAKDYENLLRAFVLVREAEERAELWIAGEGMGLYAVCMQALADELGVSGAMRWLGLRRDVDSLLDAADAFVLSSAWEGMPLAVGEAMAMEKPVVATDVGGVHELLADCGILVPAMNSALLARAMLDVMRSGTSAKWAVVCHGARRRIEEQFSMDVTAGKWEQLFRSLLAKPD
jgi:glycosyltransferase involved in cell wall biosynthesis